MEIQLYKVVNLPETRGCRTLAVAVAVAGAKKGSWAKKIDGVKMKIDDEL